MYEQEFVEVVECSVARLSGPEHLWGEAVHILAYLTKQSPTNVQSDVIVCSLDENGKS